MADKKINPEDGQWVTIKGRHVFIKDGESLEDALKRDSKDTANKNEDVKNKQIAQNALRRAVDKFEDDIRNQSYETAGMFDAEGNLILNKDGEKSSVYFTDEEQLKVKNTPDCVFTHNHPSGNGFSFEDLFFAVNLEVREMRACHKNGYYSLTRQYEWGDSVPARYLDFPAAFKQAKLDYCKNVVDDIYNKTFDADLCNKMVFDHNKEWIKKNAEYYGWKYKEG